MCTAFIPLLLYLEYRLVAVFASIFLVFSDFLPTFLKMHASYIGENKIQRYYPIIPVTVETQEVPTTHRDFVFFQKNQKAKRPCVYLWTLRFKLYGMFPLVIV